MQQKSSTVEVLTKGRGLYEFTPDVANWIASSGLTEGILTLLIQHTSASLVIQENADPDVQLDLDTYFTRTVPDDPRQYRHIAEGADDMPAHIRSALTDTSLSIPVLGGRMRLGTWQGIYLFEHRTSPHQRKIALHLMGE
ncbi:MAG: secondary thiamine-phosphate synthase enzyme YjbQ [Sneathiellales bacterium]|nr:secondary thiamine-phosphate synthase enzyme YjbQ [Sneathiellales bacterium]